MANSMAAKPAPVELTHYHSFFASLLSWDDPKATGITFATIIISIFAARYLDLLRYVFKAIWFTLLCTVLAEGAGKLLFNYGLASHFKPRKYFTMPKDTVDAMTSDLHDLLNFFVIESQRIVFAENLLATSAAFLGAFFSYFLVKFVPLWVLAVLSVSTVFLAPLVYKNNQEVIDEQVAQLTELINHQTAQLKELAGQHASKASQATRQYVGEYSAKAQTMMGSARGFNPKAETDSATAVKESDFPAAPTGDLVTETAPVEPTPAAEPEKETIAA